MEMERLEFPEALKILAARTGVKLESRVQGSPIAELKERLLVLHHLATEYYHYILTKHVVGERARIYLKQRGMTDALITTFELGFAPSAWDNVSKYLLKKGFTPQELIKSGIALSGRTGMYDRFRDRIIFPIKNVRGETIAFSGRVLDGGVQEAKYINSPETPLYTKGETLFGIHKTYDSIRKLNSCVVTEGEFDVISSYHAGVTNVVAIKGSALTESQVRLLKRFTDRLALALDQDIAGDAATRRGIEIADKAGFEIRIVEVPLGKDPDDAARENADVWKKAVGAAVPYFDFLISSAFKRFGTDEAYSKKRISDELLPVFAKIENPILQAHYIKRLSKDLSVSEENIADALKKLKFVTLREPFLSTLPIKTPHEHPLEEHLLSLVVQAEKVEEALDRVCTEIGPSDLALIPVQKIFMLLIDVKGIHEKIDISTFGKTIPEELLAVFDRAYLNDLSHLTAQTWTAELATTLARVKKSLLRRKIKAFTTQIHDAEISGDEKKVGSVNRQVKETSASLKQLM